MEISYSDLESFPKWRDGLHWWEEMENWSRAYEVKCMVPHATNQETGVQTTELLLYDVPQIMRPAGRLAVSALMEDRLRTAMMAPEPSKPFMAAVLGLLKVRQLALRYLALPRPYIFRHKLIAEDANAHGRYNLVTYENEPYYVEANFRNRWGIQAWYKWATGRPIPGDMTNKFKPEGYCIETCGPEMFQNKGMAEIDGMKSKMHAMGRGGCPFVVAELDQDSYHD
jgi:hypothetical protein